MRRRTQKTRQTALFLPKTRRKKNQREKKEHTPPTSLHKFEGHDDPYIARRVVLYSNCIVRDVSFSEETENSRDHLRFWRPRDTILSDRNTRTTTGRERCARHIAFDFYGSNDSFCRLPQRSLSRCVYSRARRRRAREYRADAKNDAREREKSARLFLAGVARFIQVASARARDFFPRVQHTETNTIQETVKKRGEKRRLSLSRKSSTPTICAIE